MTVAIRIAGIARTPLATHPRVASPPKTARAPRAGGGVLPGYRRCRGRPGSGLALHSHARRAAIPRLRDSRSIIAPHFRVIMFPASYHVSRGSLVL